MSRTAPRPQPSQRPPDPAVLALARALARQAAREDHAAEQRGNVCADIAARA